MTRHTTPCDEVRLSLGVYVLGALDERESALVEAHLDTCPACQDELAELSGLPPLLSRVSVADIQLAAAPPRAVLDRLLADSAKRHKRSRLLLTLAASVVLMAVGGSVVVSTMQARQETAATVAGAAPEAAAPEARSPGDGAGDTAFSAPVETAAKDSPMAESQLKTEQVWYEGSSGPVNLALGLVPEEGGTRVDIELSGVPAGTACRLIAVDRNGTVSPVSSWTVKAQDYQGTRARLPSGSSEYTIEQIDRFELITSAGRQLVAVPIGPSPVPRSSGP
ncbi:anti-sigma factor family protein [Acrocarpospora catenulata]|uniref:anti-sigma factor family protein n=1 Tax=Acrocarpospora catenulata TaxID=2836182 RepID=UPI001BDAB850|nr:zf-HC2 domain-containing protein [Acrocarpospora catenulata]